MSDHRIPGGIISLSNIYLYKGVTFEWHSYCGPILLRKDGEPSNRNPGPKFYALMKEWRALPKSKREKTRTHG